MTIETAFQQLISDNTNWHKLTAMSKAEARLFFDAFIHSGTNSEEVKNILVKAGYFNSEIWAKSPSPQDQQVAPRTGIVDNGPNAK
jgi:hypothetical protein